MKNETTQTAPATAILTLTLYRDPSLTAPEALAVLSGKAYFNGMDVESPEFGEELTVSNARADREAAVADLIDTVIDDLQLDRHSTKVTFSHVIEDGYEPEGAQLIARLGNLPVRPNLQHWDIGKLVQTANLIMTARDFDGLRGQKMYAYAVECYAELTGMDVSNIDPDDIYGVERHMYNCLVRFPRNEFGTSLRLNAYGAAQFAADVRDYITARNGDEARLAAALKAHGEAQLAWLAALPDAEEIVIAPHGFQRYPVTVTAGEMRDEIAARGCVTHHVMAVTLNPLESLLLCDAVRHVVGEYVRSHDDRNATALTALADWAENLGKCETVTVDGDTECLCVPLAY